MDVCYNHSSINISIKNILSQLESDATMENPGNNQAKKPIKISKFVIGGILLLIAVVILVITSLKGNAQYYLTVDELLASPQGEYSNVRVSGVVLGDTIQYDSKNLILTFTIANIPGDNQVIEEMGGIAQVLHNAASDPHASRLQVEYHDVKPDLLKNEAQAIITGRMGDNGVFYADELLLKCPSRYEDSLPEQSAN